MHDQTTGSRLHVTCRRVGRRILGGVLLLFLGGCATSRPLPGLLTGWQRPRVTPPPMASIPEPPTTPERAPVAAAAP